MKKLSQTWKQKRPRRANEQSKSTLNDEKQANSYQISDGVSRKITGSELDRRETVHKQERDGMKDYFEKDVWPSLNASSDWTIEALATIKQVEAKRQTQCLKDEKPPHSLQSPMANKAFQSERDRISTPIDTSNGSLLNINKGAIISPVFTASRIKYQEENKFADLETIPDNFHVQNTVANNSIYRSKGYSRSDANASKDGRKHNFSAQHSKTIPSSGHFTMSIDSWNLPACVTEKYKACGINKIFEWQKDCLLTGKALNGGNLVYSAPTSAGKTLVAEMLMLKRILNTKRKAIYVLPFVSVAREKMFYLQEMFKCAGVRVDGYMGALSPSGGFVATDIAVCTIEKANSLVNRLMEEKKMSSLGVVVIDEMHMIGDGHRGYLLELMLSKIRFLQEGSSNADEFVQDQGVQIVGMSATLPNLEMLAKWLNADLYLTDYRPVPLLETIKVGTVVMDENMQKISEIDSNDVVRGDEDHVIPLCLETIRNCHSVLIFCPTKQWCESLAKTVAESLRPFVASDGKKNDDKVTGDNRTSFLDGLAISEVVEQLKRSPVGLDKTVAEVVSAGVSFHHAGLTFDERDIIEGAFKRGAVRVLVATSTLSSGVNLPARRVILRTPMFHGKVINSLVYKQMTGRAGRKGVDTRGESILICKPNEKQKGIKLLKSHLEPVYSCLIGVNSDSEVPGMKRALLEIIAAGVATTRADVERYARCTYLNVCLAARPGNDPNIAIQNTITFLLENEFIREQKQPTPEAEDESVGISFCHPLEFDKGENCIEKLSPTQLGSATLASALSPDEALVVFKELQKARRCFVLENELHIVYQVMPIYMQSQWPELDWYRYYSLFEKLPPQYKRVGEIVGVEEAFLARAIRGRITTRTEEQRQKLAIHQRFYSALVLLELVNEIPLRTVSRRYNVSKGLLQSLQNSASTFAGMVTKFCQRLGWRNLELLVDQFQCRLSFGVTRELCDLVRITLLNGARARLLYNAGYHTVSALAVASPTDLTKLLENFAPFESRKNLQGENAWETASKKRLRSFWVTGRSGMTESEAAELIVNEAKGLVRGDLASMGVQLNDVQFMENSAPNHGVDATAHETSVEGDSKHNVKCGASTVNNNDGLKFTESSIKNKSNSAPTSCCISPPKQQLQQEQSNKTVVAEDTVNDKRTKIDDEVPTPKNDVCDKKERAHTKQGMRADISPMRNRRSFSIHQSIQGVHRNNFANDSDKISVDSKNSEAIDSKENVPPPHINNIIETSSPEINNASSVSTGKRSFDEMSAGVAQDSFNLNSLLNSQDFDVCSTALKDTNYAKHSKSIKNNSLDLNLANALDSNEQNVISVVQHNRSDSFADNSLEQANGSFILINSREDESFTSDKLESKKDLTPELFTELHDDDVILEKQEDYVTLRMNPEMKNQYAMSKIPRTSSDAFSYDTDALQGTTGILQDSASLLEKLFKNDEDAVIVSGDEDNDVSKLIERENGIENSKEQPELSDCKTDRKLTLNGNTSSSSILFESFGSFSSPLNEQNELSLCLKLSESMTEEGEEKALEHRSLDKADRVSGSSYMNKALNESSIDVLDDSKERSSNDIEEVFTRIGKPVVKAFEGDSEIAISESDSFAQAMCEIGLNEAIPKESDPLNGPTYNKDKSAGVKRRSSERLAKRRSCESENFTIIDAMIMQERFDSFMEEWGSKRVFSFSVARPSSVNGNLCDAARKEVDVAGIAVCFGGKTAYFIDFAQCNLGCGVAHERAKANVARVIRKIAKSDNSVKRIVFDAKEHLKTFIDSIGIEIDGTLNDPKVAAWLLDPGSKEPTFQELAMRHLPNDYKELARKIGSSYDAGSIGLMWNAAAAPRLRASVEAVVIRKLMSILELRLASEGLYSCFSETEMPIMRILAKMESNGFGFSVDHCDTLSSVLRSRMNDIEKKARKLAGRPFLISAPDDVAQLLFIELGLPASGDPDLLINQKRGVRGRRPRHLSTAKGILEKLKKLHPLPSLILEWRKVNNALSTVVYPMQYAKKHCQDSNMYRIHSCCQFHTITGRVITSEPCVQNVPKDFYLTEDISGNVLTDKQRSTKLPRYRDNEASRLADLNEATGTLPTPVGNFSQGVSMRSAFVPSKGGILIAADYSQLELRIIAHLSRDVRLLSILNDKGDVFRMIAAETNQCRASEVTDEQRQNAKHVCYGIIYGIGPKALSDKLQIDENKASLFMEKFKNRFPGIRVFTQRTIEFAKANGYILTINRRKRYFSTINSKNAHARSQAERQAVNTTVQGSAADLVKKAMINIDDRIKLKFANKKQTDSLKLFSKVPKSGVEPTNKQAGTWLRKPRLVLQLHDELIYESSLSDCNRFIEILKKEMEQALKLEVHLPVKVRTGSNWGVMTECV